MELRHPLTGLSTVIGLSQIQMITQNAALKAPANDFAPFTQTYQYADLQKAVEDSAIERNKLALKGMLQYSQSDLPGPQPSPDDSTPLEHGITLHHYFSTHSKSAKRPLLLFVPSLINRYTILDLMPGNSFLRYCSEQGFDTAVIDWGQPEASQAEWNSAAYSSAVIDIVENLKRPAVLAGYCMGGVLALAATQACTNVQGVALLATPWDYATYNEHNAAMQHGIPNAWLNHQEFVSADQLQSLFYLANPYRLFRRYGQFALLKDKNDRQRFVAVEHWAQDGVALSARVAGECLLEWPRHNTLMANEWRVRNKRIQPRRIDKPALVVIPTRDHIVPQRAAAPLATLLPKAEVISPRAGHVSMVAGRYAKSQLWQPFTQWLEAQT